MTVEIILLAVLVVLLVIVLMLLVHVMNRQKEAAAREEMAILQAKNDELRQQLGTQMQAINNLVGRQVELGVHLDKRQDETERQIGSVQTNLLNKMDTTQGAITQGLSGGIMTLTGKLERINGQQHELGERVQAVGQQHELLQKGLSGMVGDSVRSNMETLSNMMSTRFTEMNAGNTAAQSEMRKQFQQMLEQNNAAMDRLEKRFSDIQAQNGKKLDEMRGVVEEKMQAVLRERIDESFGKITANLTQLQQSIGEFKAVGTEVGDIKRLFSNVKSRGTFGELQLGRLLEDILAPGQYERNAHPKKSNQNNVVEFALKLPGRVDGETVYLPVDSKFPLDAYNILLAAEKSGDAVSIEQARKTFATRVGTFAKEIHDKYIEPPYTTEFGIMYLPSEGIYAEVARSGLIEELQTKYKVNIAGPSTMAAFINCVNMGFKTLAVQKNSSKIASLLKEVNQEFGKYSAALEKVKASFDRSSQDLETLMGTRTRVMQRKLVQAEALDLDELAGTQIPQIGLPVTQDE